MNYMFNEMVKLIQYDYIMRSEVFSTNAFIQICNFSMNAALFRRFACRPAAFLAVWGGQTKEKRPLRISNSMQPVSASSSVSLQIAG